MNLHSPPLSLVEKLSRTWLENPKYFCNTKRQMGAYLLAELMQERASNRHPVPHSEYLEFGFEFLPDWLVDTGVIDE